MRSHLSCWVRAFVAAVACATAAPAYAQGVTFDADTFGGLQARAIGPAAMSGRISALDAVGGDRLTIYVGSAGGGLWRSMDGGLVFKPVFDKYAPAIGAVTVDPSNRKIVWVGTGESWVRNSVSPGDGVYRSIDGGDSWTRLGLAETERIARILVHPKDSNTVFVCATGHLFDDHPDRGVYRTKDAGMTWEKVLFVAADTGCGDLAMDAQDASVLYAGMWQFRRSPWSFASGGPRSGLYRSKDGGASWERLTKGLPAGDLGRIGLAVAPAKAGVVFATVESKRTMLYRSDDRGETWVGLSDSSFVNVRPFYYSRLLADPKNPDRLYKLGTTAAVSDDGGKTFSGLGGGNPTGPSYHSDVHDAWIDPANPERIILGTDGGVYISYDRGSTFRFVGSLPVSQFYHVSHDMAWPYNVYGGLQDNSTWYGPSRAPGGIANRHWRSLTGGDGFWVFPDPGDPDVVYNEYQGGNLFRIRKSTLEAKDIKPSPKAGEPRYRFNWNTPIHMSAGTPGTIYYAAQFLFRSRDRGESWERISPDLTTNDPAKQKQNESGGLTPDNSTAENHCTIVSIAESPANSDVIWVGTDDGNVQVTRDGGRTWSNAAAKVPGVPARTWVSSIAASRTGEGTAFVTFDGHMTGDSRPYVFKTTDFGATWTALASPDIKGYVHVVKEDPVNPTLLFAGTEFGLWVSLNGGTGWAQFTGGLPAVAVRDMVIHPREHDLILATHGRGIYIVDDITPLRALTSEVLERDVAFLPTRPSAMAIPVSEFGFNGDAEFAGANPGDGAVIAYYLKRRHLLGDLRIEVLDSGGQVLSAIPGGKRRGINRVEWSMRAKAPRAAPGAGLVPSFGSLIGPRVAPGTYAVRMIKGKDSFSSTVTVVPEPGSRHSDEDRAMQGRTVRTLYGMVERLAFLVDAITGARDQARTAAAGLADKDPLQGRLSAFAESLDRQRTALVSSQRGEGISGEEKLREEIGLLYGNVNVYEGRPTQSQIDRMSVLDAELTAAVGRFEALMAKDGAVVNAQLAGKKLPAISKLTRDEWERRRPG